MMYKILLLLLVTGFCSCGQAPKSHDGSQAKLFDNKTKMEVIAVPGGYGYAIRVNGENFIRQENIPVLQGSHAFINKQDAEKVGNWVASRIRHNEEFSLTLPVLKSLIHIEDTTTVAANR